MKFPAIVAVCLVCSWAVSAQTPEPMISDTYVSFFQKLTDLKSLSNPSPLRLPRQLNGKSVTISVPKIQDLAGLTDFEVSSLESIAANCLASLKPLQKPNQSVFEYRLEQIETAQTSAALEQQMADMAKQQEEAVAAHVQRLRVIFGDSRFQTLEDYVRSGKWRKDFTPNITSPLP
jgi:hypothetical protein